MFWVAEAREQGLNPAEREINQFGVEPFQPVKDDGAVFRRSHGLVDVVNIGRGRGSRPLGFGWLRTATIGVEHGQ